MQFDKVGNIPTGATVVPTSVMFEDGDYEKTFVIKISEDSVGIEGKVVFYKSELDSDAFELEEVMKSFAVTAKDEKLPVVIDSQIIDLQKHSASFTIVTDEISKLSYAVLRRGTRYPTVAELDAGKFDETETVNDIPKFGHSYDYTKLSSDRYFYTITIDKLLS